MPHDEFWIVQNTDDGTICGQCTTCGWTTSRYPNNGIIPNQLTMERMRHGEKPDAPTLDLTAIEVFPGDDPDNNPDNNPPDTAALQGKRPDEVSVER